MDPELILECLNTPSLSAVPMMSSGTSLGVAILLATSLVHVCFNPQAGIPSVLARGG